MWIATAAHVRAMDRTASEEFGIPTVVLMERAGLAVFECIKTLLPEGGRVSILCGKGNNGGDGLAVSRLMHDTGRYGVEVLIAAQEGDLSPECQVQLNIARSAGVQPIFTDDARWKRRLDCLGGHDLVIDALLGTGAHGEVHGAVLEAIRGINRSGVPVVAVDVPSGIHTDTGEDLGESVWALRTVTLGWPKPFLFHGLGLEHAGYWSVADIGHPATLLESGTDARLLDKRWVSDVIPERLRAAHKRDNGHVLVIAGSNPMPGAALLAVMAAMRSGVGLVTLAAPKEVCRLVLTRLPEAICVPLDAPDGYLASEHAHAVLEAAVTCDSAVIGPGLGFRPSVREFLDRLWSHWELPSVIDADALNAIAAGVPVPGCEFVMTPHPGEMGRLMDCSAAEVQHNRFQTVRQAVEKFGGTVVLKGPHTIIGDVDQPLAVNATGNSGMASAGMGDVLSGIVGALLAQDLPPYCAASAAVYLHGHAGDLAADKIGPVGFLASDVASLLPEARAKLIASCEGRSRVQSLPLSCQL